MNPGSTQFQEDLRFRVMRILQERPAISNREIAQELGVSVGGVHYCLSALATKGMIKVRNFRTSRNKLRYIYNLTPKGIAEQARLTGVFLKRRMAEYEALRAEIDHIRTSLKVDASR